jgi:hypothetical protein
LDELDDADAAPLGGDASGVIALSEISESSATTGEAIVSGNCEYPAVDRAGEPERRMLAEKGL